MKVLHVIPSLSELRGGPTFVLNKMMSGLSARGVGVDVACTDDDGKDRLKVPLGIPLARNGGAIYYFRRDTLRYTFSRSLFVWLWKNAGSYDVIHAHALFSFPTLAAAIAAIRHRKPYIIRPVGTLSRWGFENRRPVLKKIWFKMIESQILRHATAIHVTSQQERKEVHERYPPAVSPSIIPDYITSKTVVIHEPTGLYQKSASGLTASTAPLSGRRVILFLSRIDKKKGLDILLPAFATVHKSFPDTLLVVAGDGESNFVSDLRTTAETLGIAASVVWTGFVSGEAKWDLLRQANIFVLPSYAENFAVVVLEAMSCGTPVVISDNVALAEDVGPSAVGVVVKSTMNSLIEGLRMLLSDSSFAKSLGERGRDFAIEKFSEASCMEKLIGLYLRVLTLNAR